MKVLVVDDDATISALVAWVLSDEGHEVALAANGRAALQVLESMRPDLILLDMRMPIMDGWEFARRYRKRGGGLAPVVVMTAAEDAARRAQEIDADGCLAKPFDVDDLVATASRFAPSR